MLLEKMGMKHKGWLIAALPCSLMVMTGGIQTAQAGNYADVIASQTPLAHWEFNDTAAIAPLLPVVDNLDLLMGADQYIIDANAGGDIGYGVASMTPSGGFDGFESTNTAFNFNTSGSGSVITHIFNPDTSNPEAPSGDPMTMQAGSVSMWINCTDPNAADPFISGFLWVGHEGGGDNLKVQITDVGGTGVVLLALEDGEFDVLSAATSGSIDYSDGNWHHIAATWSYDAGTDAGSLNLYMDGGVLGGGEESSTSFTATEYPDVYFEPDPENNPGVFEYMDFDHRNRIGKGRNDARRYNGDMDEFAAWNRVLSAQEIADQYAAAFEEGPEDIPGDLNGDGFVGLDDLDIVLQAWNQNVPPADAAADPSGDGYVGLDDLDIVLNNWNAGTPPASTVPEPATFALLGLGGLAALRRR